MSNEYLSENMQKVIDQKCASIGELPREEGEEEDALESVSSYTISADLDDDAEAAASGTLHHMSDKYYGSI